MKNTTRIPNLRRPLIARLKGKTKMLQDQGSILILGLSMAIISLMVATLGINIATLWSTRVTLNRIADGVALTASQAVDVNNIYRTGTVRNIHLDRALARSRAIQYLKYSQVRDSLTNVKLVRLVVAGSTVSVTLSCSAKLPFGYLMNHSSVSVKASASAANLAK